MASLLFNVQESNLNSIQISKKITQVGYTFLIHPILFGTEIKIVINLVS